MFAYPKARERRRPGIVLLTRACNIPAVGPVASPPSSAGSPCAYLLAVDLVEWAAFLTRSPRILIARIQHGQVSSHLVDIHVNGRRPILRWGGRALSQRHRNRPLTELCKSASGRVSNFVVNVVSLGNCRDHRCTHPCEPSGYPRDVTIFSSALEVASPSCLCHPSLPDAKDGSDAYAPVSPRVGYHVNVDEGQGDELAVAAGLTFGSRSGEATAAGERVVEGPLAGRGWLNRC